MRLSKGKAIEAAMKDGQREELKDKLREAISLERTFVVLPTSL